VVYARQNFPSAAMNRREFQLVSQTAARARVSGPPDSRPHRRVTAAAGVTFRHNSGATAEAPARTLGSGCAFLDYDGDGWPDILFVNSMDWRATSVAVHAAPSA
jgi:hypothetical protein